MTTVGTLAPLVQDFFAQHLLGYKRSSPQTVAAYRDTFRLLLAFLKQLRGREPSQRHRCERYPGVPGPPRNRSEELDPFPECASGGSPLFLSFRGVSRTSSPRPGQPSARHPHQT
jgi:hypothetical protein